MHIANISCDGVNYALPAGKHDAANLRAFFGVDDDHDLWAESYFRRGDDVLVADSFEVVTGARFYTTFRKING